MGRTVGTLPGSDSLALEALFKSCGGAGWHRKGGWMSEAELGEWRGVTLDMRGRVVELDLCWNNLAAAVCRVRFSSCLL